MVNTINAQIINNNVTASGGTTLKKGNVQLEFTVGETCINTLSSATNKITQGFHQPNILVQKFADPSPPYASDPSRPPQGGGENAEEFSESEREMQNSELEINVFPNPVTDFVNITSVSNEQINLTLTDAQGKIIQQLKYNAQLTQIDFTKLNAGTYFIVAQSVNGQLRNTYKVIKQH